MDRVSRHGHLVRHRMGDLTVIPSSSPLTTGPVMPGGQTAGTPATSGGRSRQRAGALPTVCSVPRATNVLHELAVAGSRSGTHSRERLSSSRTFRLAPCGGPYSHVAMPQGAGPSVCELLSVPRKGCRISRCCPSFGATGQINASLSRSSQRFRCRCFPPFLPRPATPDPRSSKALRRAEVARTRRISERVNSLASPAQETR